VLWADERRRTERRRRVVGSRERIMADEDDRSVSVASGVSRDCLQPFSTRSHDDDDGCVSVRQREIES